MKQESLKAEKLREEQNKNMMDLMEKKLKDNLDAMKEMSVSRQSRSSRRSGASRSMKKRVRLKLLFGATSKRVPELPKTLEELKGKVQAHIDTDDEVKAHLGGSEQYVLTYTDDSNDTIKLCNDDDLKSALEDGLEAEGGILKINVNPGVKKVKEEAKVEGNEEVQRLLEEAQKIKEEAQAEADEMRFAAAAAKRASESPGQRPSVASRLMSQNNKLGQGLGGL